MSSSPEPHPHSSGTERIKRRERPPALDFKAPHKEEARSDREDAPQVNTARVSIEPPPTTHLTTHHQPLLHVSVAEPEEDDDDDGTELALPRSASATSSLDPYYFGVGTPSESPVLQSSPMPQQLSLKTPELGPFNDPVTPRKDPAAIDRRGLVGVGELATPRWARGERKDEVEVDDQLDEEDDDEEEVYLDDSQLSAEVEGGDLEKEPDLPDSPWTIEAIDGEPDDLDEFLDVQPPPRSLRTKRSIADESGGEEILYPRQQQPSAHGKSASAAERESSPAAQKSPSTEAPTPPSAFATAGQRPRKRTSEEFELDYTSGLMTSKHTSAVPASTAPKDKDKARRHRSLGPGIPSAASSTSKEKPRDSRRDTLSVSTKHSRQVSASSSSSSHGEPHSSHHSRRLHTSDYSHLPPSPGSSSIQQFLRHASTGSAGASGAHGSAKEQPAHSSTSHVAHSLLRGTQEGWSDMDDQATVEALRKLDGVSGKSARARSSIGAHSRVGSTSRSSTPAKGVNQWEGVENRRTSRIGSSHGSISGKDKLKEHTTSQRSGVGLGIGVADTSMDSEVNGHAANASIMEEQQQQQQSSPPPEKAKKHTSMSQRASFTPKRGSASSTTYTSTPTTSSRDSATLSTATSNTSVSAASGRQSSSMKAKRNSAGSDISSHSADATSFRDRAAALAAPADIVEENSVPPVPPLPKDLSTLKPQQHSSASSTFPASDSDEQPRHVPQLEPAVSLEVPTFSTSSKHHSLKTTTPSSSTTTTPHKTPSKKWSFSNPLGKKLVSSPSQSSMKDSKSAGLVISPRALSFTQQLRKSTSRDHPPTPSTARKQSGEEWTNINVDAMGSASSLVSLSSMGSVHHPISPPASVPPPITTSKTPDRLIPSRPETASSSSTNLTASLPPVPQQMPLSPSSSIRRGPSTKRLTPSSIPFFRRSSSQSMQMPPPGVQPSSSPTYSSSASNTYLRPPSATSPTKEVVTSPTTSKKSSVFGLPSLLKGSSSRRSLHSDKEKSDSKSGRDDGRSDKEKTKKDEKDRSESRISVLMGRKRGKTLSSAQPKKTEPVAMPPMHVSALPPATAQRLANMKTGSQSSLSSTQSTPKTSRITSQTASSMAKQSDASLRSTRNALPTIAGSPSVGTLPHQSSKEPPPSSSLNNSSILSKDTPTKIPRISSRSSAANSPTLKAGRRASVIINSNATPSRGTSPQGNESMANEFGVFENGSTPKTSSSTVSQRQSIRASPSTANATATSRVPRQVSASSSSTVNGPSSTRKNRDSISFSGLRKSSTGSVASITTSATTQNDAPQPAHTHRFSALSPSKGLKLLSPKISLATAARHSTVSASQSITQAMSSPSTSRHPTSTPSPVSSLVDEDELLGDEEMLQYIKKQQAKKLASGASQADLDEMLRFPEPIPPAAPASPAVILKSSQVHYLSEYERKEILDYPSVYCIGAKSDKKPATTDNSTNNHGYDDERGDYLVVLHDHLAYRYEIIDTLGKGSFGQVLHCRDHCTGESVAIKIIRNKKRFHHQALVEIKILDSLRKWDQDEKHHVIKMTEHFYFRGHLCIAMELLSINLYELIKANSFVGFSTGLIRRFTSQMLHSLALMRHHRIVHCDLKPENVLLRHPAKSAIKVIDFGSSCFEHEKIYTYIQSRFYRSPEVILGMNYHMAIDMWSLGCIMAELYTGFPIFPGENEQEQLTCIMEVLGVPDKDFVSRSSRRRLFFDQTGAPRPVVNSKGRRRRPGSKTLQQVLRCDDDLFVDFISKCLVWDPERRLKPHAALRHPYISGGKRAKLTSPQPSASTSKTLLNSASASFTSNRSSKTVTETPKKSLISAPTPLTARTSRVISGAVPTTPSSNSGSLHTTLGSSRSYRASQTQSLSYHSSHSSRTMLAK